MGDLGNVTEEMSAPAAPTTNWWNRIPVAAKIAGFAAITAIIGLIVVLIVINSAQAASPFEDALDDCRVRPGLDAKLLDDGNSLMLNMAGEETGGLETATVVCVLNALEIPDATIERMSSTRSLDGRQSDEFNGIRAEWTYHPDEGLDVLLTR